MLPTTALTSRTSRTSGNGSAIVPTLANSPTLNSRVSPGKAKPISSPHSAKITAAVTHSAQVPADTSICSGSSQPGPSAWVTARVASVAITCRAYPRPVRRSASSVNARGPSDDV